MSWDRLSPLPALESWCGFLRSACVQTGPAPGPWASPLASPWGQSGPSRAGAEGAGVWGPRSFRRCVLDPGAVLGGPGRILYSLAKPRAEALVGAADRWTPGDPRGLREPWVRPAMKEPARSPGKLARCLPSGAFSCVGSVRARWWGWPARERGTSCPLDLGGGPFCEGLGSSSFPFCRDEMETGAPRVACEGSVGTGSAGPGRGGTGFFLFPLVPQQAPSPRSGRTGELAPPYFSR